MGHILIKFTKKVIMGILLGETSLSLRREAHLRRDSSVDSRRKTPVG
jgi:hypothetical protein